MKIIFVCILLNLLINAEILVITSKDNKLQNISDKKLSNIYLKKVTKIGDKKIVPIDNIDDYDKFYKKVVKKTPQQIHAYWMKEIFTGKKRPPKRVSRQEVSKELKSTKKSISYSTKQLDAKVIHEIK